MITEEKINQFTIKDLPDKLLIEFGKAFLQERLSDIITEMKLEKDVNKIRTIQLTEDN